MATPSCHSAARNLLTAIFCHCEQVSLWRNRLARSAVNRKVGGSSPPRDASFGPFNVHCYYYLSPHTRLGIHPTKAPRGLGRSRLAQSVEHQTLNLRVVGSSPTLGDFFLSLPCLFVPPLSAAPTVMATDIQPAVRSNRSIIGYFLGWRPGFCGVVVITSALHAEGHEFDPRQNLSFFFFSQTFRERGAL